MSDALLQVGAQCAFPSCNLNDFLPIKCKCKSTFCRDHIFPDNHSCSAVKEYDADSSAASQFGQLKRCAFGECTKPSLYAFTAEPDRETCDKCHSAFCVQHRHPDTHACTPEISEASTSTSSARDLLQKNFGSKLSSTSRSKPLLPKKKPPTDPVKLAQYRKVQLMKLKHTAAPLDPKDAGVRPPEDRITISVAYNTLEKPFWFRKAISTGKAIDLLTTQFKIPPASSSRSIQLLISTGDEDPTLLKNDQLLADQVEDGASLALSLAN